MPAFVMAMLLLPSFIGLWNPRVGEGAIYAVQDRQGEVERLEVQVTGQLGPDYWVEVTYHGLDERRIRQLVGPSGAVRVVVEEGGERRELAPGMWQGGGLPLPVAQVGQAVGNQTLTAAGAPRVCQVFLVEGSRLWVCPEVSPFGLVRLESRDLKLELIEVICQPGP